MKRLHVHVAVNDLEQSIGFYSALFAAHRPSAKTDYAKWMLDDPRVNFAISTRGRQAGLDHLGIQVENKDELTEIYGRLHKAGGNVIEQGQTSCCYAKSEKSWIDDPAGISWETFLTSGESTDYGDGTGERDARRRESAAYQGMLRCRRPRKGVPWPINRSTCSFFVPAIRPARSWRRQS